MCFSSFESLIVTALWLTLTPLCTSKGVPIIKTTSGKLQGTAITNSTNAYLGIPYAIPPLGQLRFAAPLELYTPTITRNATGFGSSCIQFHPPVLSPTGESENCLFLNVWTSATVSSNQKKPVLVWLPGGGWNTGSTSLPVEDLTGWATAHPEIVFVSINYRLNLFGYPDTPAITRPNTNAGLRDQRLAVEWVHKNIATFGGDPNHLIFGGESAGSGSVSGYLYAYPGDPLIKGALMMSGQAPLQSLVGRNPLTPDVPPENSFPVIASAVGCPLQNNNFAAQLYCVRQRSTTDLVTALGQLNVTVVGPVIDNQTVHSYEEYKSRGKAGKFIKVPILTGTVENEADIFVLDRATNTVNEAFSDLLTLAAFRCFDSWQSSFSVAAGLPTYRYHYLPLFPTISIPPLRVFHQADQFIVFGTSQKGRGPDAPPPTELEQAATVYMQRAWSAFIGDPANGLKGLGWPRYKGYTGQTLVGIFPNNSVENPIQTTNPTDFDAGCAALGLGL
ncbi:hypothetical protein FRC19_011208 [Serendipita sp. 401]|nr:hypothetical protein FRC19_011208 [Serendipita sp. 401]